MDLLSRILDTAGEKGITQADLAHRLGLTRNAVTEWKRGTSRAYVKYLYQIADILGVSVEYLRGESEKEKPTESIPGMLTVDGGVQHFPVLGSVKAGYDGLAIEEETDEVCQIPTALLHGRKKEDYFVLRVSGDSMFPRLLDGDMILVERTDSVDSGTTAVILYDGEDATVKRVKYMPGENWLELIPDNPKYERKRIEGADLAKCRVLGRVCQLIRNM